MAADREELVEVYRANSTIVSQKVLDITLDTPVSGETLVFRSARGERFEVQAAGDNDNLLGLGTFRLSSDTATSFDYTSVTGGVATVTTTAAQTFEFSIGGGAVESLTIAAGSAATETAAATALNAAVMPPVSRYMGVLREALDAEGVKAPLLIMKSDGGDSQARHVAEFLDAVRGGKRPSCTPEDAYQSAVTVQLGMISYYSGSRVDWDARSEQITNSPAAARLLQREYRAPYKHPYSA